VRSIDYWKVPFWTLALATGAKSFKDNPVLGSRRLNARGLHVRRCLMAERLSDWRRRWLSTLVDGDARAQYAKTGFIQSDNVLSPEDLSGVRHEIETGKFDSWEMKQGNAVTRFIPLPPAVLNENPHLKKAVEHPSFRRGLQYVASTSADPIVYLHVVLTQPQKGQPDPQTHFHSDTFQPTAKAWLFLYDVKLEDGPFAYIPGSHRLTEGRLAWEKDQSVLAAENPNVLHGRGSFRLTLEDAKQMGFGDPVAFAVPGNTLVVADTHGFHARSKSAQPSVRVGLYGSLRRNPFLPFTGFDPFLWPGLKHRQARLHMLEKEVASKWFGKRNSHRYVGKISPTAPSDQFGPAR